MKRNNKDNHHQYHNHDPPRPPQHHLDVMREPNMRMIMLMITLKIGITIILPSGIISVDLKKNSTSTDNSNDEIITESGITITTMITTTILVLFVIMVLVAIIRRGSSLQYVELHLLRVFL